MRLLQRFAEDVAEYGVVENTPTIDGRNMVMIIGPASDRVAPTSAHRPLAGASA